MQLILRGAFLQVAGWCAGLPLAATAYTPVPMVWWVGAFLGLCLVLTVAGVSVSLTGYRRAKREEALGYTTVPKHATDDSSLAWIDARDGAMVSPPWHERPPSGRRADVAAFKTRWRGAESTTAEPWQARDDHR